MKISTITFVYNEEFLLPFFLKHYTFVDRMIFLYDVDSTDRTLEILKKEPKAHILPVKFPNMMDDLIKVQIINEVYAAQRDTWVLNVDADEFAFISSSFREPERDIASISFYNVYRHADEKDLDISLPIREQRCHGELDRMYVKPVFVKAGLNIKWLPGNHAVEGYPLSAWVANGAHWAGADPCFAVKRQVKDRRDRQSQFNLENQLTVQYHGITEEDVINKLKAHENDPRLW